MGSFSTIAGLTPPVLRSQLEYPKVDVSLIYLAAIGKMKVGNFYDTTQIVAVTSDSFADLAAESMGQDMRGHNIGRYVDINNTYHDELYSALTTQDYRVKKGVAGTWSVLGYEAVDIGSNTLHLVKLSCLGTSIKGYRIDMTTPKVSVTDTSLSSGGFGLGAFSSYNYCERLVSGFLRAASSPSPRAVAFYEVPIVGSGTMEDPFRAQLPDLIEVPISAELDAYPPMLKRAIQANAGGKVNRLALTHSALIPTDPTTGKPLYSTCIVRVFEQPDRQPHLWKIPEVLARLETQTAIPVKKLDVTQAIARAKEMDPRLSDFDFYAMPSPSDDEVRKYIEWRRAAFGVETRYEDAKHYLESDKGWA